MKRNTILTLVALVLIALVGLGGAFWGYKKYKQRRALANREYRYEGAIWKAKEGFDYQSVKGKILNDTLLNDVIASNDLVSKWGLEDVDAAKDRIRERFTIKVVDSKVVIGYRDKDKEIAEKVLKAIFKSLVGH